MLSSLPAVAAGTTAGQPPAPAQGQTLTVDVTVNAVPMGRWQVLDRQGVVLIPEEAWARWALRRPASAPALQHDGRVWYPLLALRGAEMRLHPAEQRMDLAIPTGQLVGTPAPAPTPAEPDTAAAAHAPSSAVPPAAPQLPVLLAAASPTATPPLGTALGAPTPPPGSLRWRPLDVIVNTVPVGNWVLLEVQGKFYAPADAFPEWRIARPPEQGTLRARQQTWYPLDGIQGFTARFNSAEQSLAIDFAANAFAATRLGQPMGQRPVVSPSEWASFLNYDLNYNASQFRGSGRFQDAGALVELGLTGPMGVLTSSHIGNNLLADTLETSARWRRLETTFTRDFPDHNLTLRLGDSISRSGLTGRGVYFGGIQIGRNYMMSPGLITQPVPVISGTSTAPSTVELYVNDVLRQTSKVPTGPFTIDNFPLLTGAGQARVVVRDLLGRETVLVQPFLSGGNMLAEGLTDWSAEAGLMRRRLGEASADYGDPFVSGLWRGGISKSLTLEAAGAWSRQVTNLGGAATTGLFEQWLGELALGLSRSALAGMGRQWTVGLNYPGMQHQMSLRLESSNDRYRALGFDPAFSFGTARRQWSFNHSMALGERQNLGWAVARIVYGGQTPITTSSINYGLRVGQRSNLSFSLSRASGANAGTSVGVAFSFPLDGNTYVNTNVTHAGNETSAYASASDTTAGERPLSWRVLSGYRGGSALAEGGLYYRGTRSQFTGDVSASSGQQAVRLGTQGGLVAMGGQLFATHTVRDSFALVEVPGYADIRVGRYGNADGVTNADGVALVSNLSAYNTNPLRLDASDLPVTAEIDAIEMNAVPAWRSAVRVKFPVRSGRAALLRIILDDGQPAPAGAEIDLQGDAQVFYVARRGEAYLTGLQPSNRLRLRHGEAACDIDVVLPEGKVDEIVRLGPFKCEGVKR